MAYPPQPPYDPNQPPQYPQIPVAPPGPPAAFAGYGPQYDPSQPQPQPPRRSLLPWLALAVTLVVAGTGGWFIYDRVIRTDPGVAACEAMRDDEKPVAGQDGDKTMTESEYRELREVFEDSRHEDIRDHGTKLIDLVWQMSKMGEEPGLEALAYVGPLTEHMTGLQSACADQGVIVDLKMGQ
jgi:hypothetical protein